MKLLMRNLRVAAYIMIPALLLATVLITPQRAVAEAPGCYDRSAGSFEFTRATCPDDAAITTGVAAGKCYVRQIVPKTASPYNEFDCPSITLTEENGGTAQAPNEFVIAPTNDCGDCITKDIQTFIDLAAIGVGVVIVIMLIIAGIQYTMSRDNPQSVQAAKSKILNAIIGLVAFIFTYAFLQWIVPGGVF